MDTTRKSTYAAPRLIEVGTLVSRTLGPFDVNLETGGLKDPAAL